MGKHVQRFRVGTVGVWSGEQAGVSLELRRDGAAGVVVVAALVWAK